MEKTYKLLLIDSNNKSPLVLSKSILDNETKLIYDTNRVFYTPVFQNLFDKNLIVISEHDEINEGDLVIPKPKYNKNILHYFSETKNYNSAKLIWNTRETCYKVIATLNLTELNKNVPTLHFDFISYFVRCWGLGINIDSVSVLCDNKTKQPIVIDGQIFPRIRTEMLDRNNIIKLLNLALRKGYYDEYFDINNFENYFFEMFED